MTPDHAVFPDRCGARIIANLNHHEKVKFSVSDCLPFGHGYDSTHDVTASSSAMGVELSRAATNMGFSERG